MTAIGHARIVNSYGEPVQQGLTTDPADYAQGNFGKLVLGIVMAVNPSDHQENRSAMQKLDRRGYLHTCTVQVIEGGGSALFTLDNVIITPDTSSGIANYYEHLPRGCTGLVTGEAWNSNFSNINPYDLDGDWCIVGFLGGNVDVPFIVRWWPHPRGYDAATSGTQNPNNTAAKAYLEQAGRHFQRVNGVEFVVTKEGDIYLSTYRANSTPTLGSPLTPSEGRFPHTTDPEQGGSIKVWVKPTQSLDLDWNTPVNGLGVQDLAEPGLPQTNPGAPGTPAERPNTYVFADQEQVLVEVPEIFKVTSKRKVLLTSDEETTLTIGTSFSLTAEQDITLSVSSGNVYLGDGATLQPLLDGVVTAQGFDPFTGQTYGALGSASSRVMARKL